ncbi:tubby C-terminal domain-like protein [Virgibacillus salexigens]|uniref:Tubby C-terminal domain-containing protein n=1 Tax=Virgibacillus kapii TaxID=1638645 RepID=A0ABQ2DZS4_9BACI|nr:MULTISPECIES: hypothetical protein [Virgibacillus]MYL43913.1 hypothetical protein [Virgibacillus massiliensis]GGJ77899.1 hypothetical protein GCM10007111_44260 [Virgibacillus kapii]
MVYTFEVPFYKRFKKKREYFNSEGKAIGLVSRYFESKLQNLISFIIDGYFLNIKVENIDNQLEIKAKHQMFSVRDKWDIDVGDNTYLLECKTKVKTNPRFIFHFGQKEYIIYRDFADKYIKIEDTSTKNIISEWKYISKVPPRKVEIQVFDETMNIHLLMCLFLILSLKYN